MKQVCILCHCLHKSFHSLDIILYLCSLREYVDNIIYNEAQEAVHLLLLQLSLVLLSSATFSFVFSVPSPDRSGGG